MLAGIKDKRVQSKIAERIDALETDPEKQGKPLVSTLSGLRSVRTVGQRYRIIYRVEEQRVVVLVVALGLRKEGDKADIYALTKKLLRLGLLE